VVLQKIFSYLPRGSLLSTTDCGNSVDGRHGPGLLIRGAFLRAVESYLTIHKVRFSGRLDAKIEETPER
jgi:hypothetical protein